MATGHYVLFVLAAGVLVFRIARALVRRGGSEDEPTYPEPTLALDHESEQPHDVFGELKSTLDADQAAEDRYLASKQAGERETDERLSESVPVSRKILLTAVGVALLLAVPYLHPSLSWLRLLSGTETPSTRADGAPESAGEPLPESAVGEAKLPGATYDQQRRARELEGSGRDERGPIAQGKSEAIPAAVEEDEPPRSIEDPSGEALDPFFEQLMRVEREDEGAQARVLYYGDSIVASDFVSGKMRRMLQSRFGDAGHGYAILANAWPGWFHIDVSRKASAEWRVSTCVGPYAEDGLYGLGCASFTSRSEGVWSEFGTATIEEYEWGKKVSRFEIEYLKQPGGGAFDVIVDGEKREVLETDAPEKEVAWHVVDVPDGPHTLRIESVDDRPARAFGMRMEREVPGVSLSAMGVTGARARFLDKQDDDHWREVLERTEANLVCLAFGSNEITDGNMYPMEDYRRTLEEVMVQVERALPNASYMLVGPPDMASKKASQGHSKPMVYFITEEQRKLAKKRGWAFWDQFRAMGGGGSMWSWIKAGLGSTDMFHPTGRGGNVLGKWEYLALMKAFEEYKDELRAEREGDGAGGGTETDGTGGGETRAGEGGEAASTDGAGGADGAASAEDGR